MSRRRLLSIANDAVEIGYAYGEGNHIDIDFSAKLPQRLIVYSDNINSSSASTSGLFSFFVWNSDNNGKVNMIAVGNKWNGAWNIQETPGKYTVTVDSSGATIDNIGAFASFVPGKPYNYIAIY